MKFQPFLNGQQNHNQNKTQNPIESQNIVFLFKLMELEVRTDYIYIYKAVLSSDPSGLHVVGGGDKDKRWWRTKMISLSLELFLLSGLFLPFRLMNDEKIFFLEPQLRNFGSPL